MVQSIFENKKTIVLASASPRRQVFLQELGLRFSVIPTSIDESPNERESALDFAQRMARTKAESIGKQWPEAAIIGADTIISLAGEILGKPENPEDALRILLQLQGTSHQVITALCLCCPREELLETMAKTTTVTFGRFPREVLEAYIRCGEPLDKAGAYAIQGKGGFLVQRINGSCSNVIGLPMHDLVRLLLLHNIISPQRTGE